MTRQVTDQLYIEIDYFTPEEYYVYVAEAQSQQTATVTMSCDAGKITEAQSTMSVQASVSATISHIEGADLFAFTEAQLSLQVSVIKDYNTASSSQFDIATDFVRTRSSEGDVDAVFSAIISGLRSRDVESQTQAAFSFSCDGDVFATISGSADLTASTTQITIVEKICQGQSSLATESTQSVTVSVTKNISANLTSTVDQNSLGYLIADINAVINSNTALSATISHIEGADLTAFSDSAINAVVNKTVSVASNLSAEFSQSTASSRIRYSDSQQTAQASISIITEATKEFFISQTNTVSLSLSADRQRDINADINITAAQATINARIRYGDSVLNSDSLLACTISHIHGADLTAFGNATLTIDAVKTADSQSTLAVQVTQNTQAAKSVIAASSLNSRATLFVSRNAYKNRPIILEVPLYPDFSTNKKFGSYSLELRPSIAYTQSYPVDIRIRSNDSFALEGWLDVNTATTTSILTILGIGNTGTASGATTIGDNQVLLVRRRYVINTAVYFHTRLLIKNSLNQTEYFDSVESTLSGVYQNYVPWQAADFEHWAITRNSSGTYNVYKNGNQIISGTVASIGTANGYRVVLGNQGGSAPNYSYWDEVSFRKGTTSISLNAQGDDSTTQVLLYHFENNVNDDVSGSFNITQTAQATITASSAISAILSGPVRAAANLSSAATLTAVAVKTNEITLTAFSDAAVNADAQRIRSADSNQNSESTVVASAERTRDNDSQITAQATSTADAVKTVSAMAEITAMYATVAAEARIRSGDIQANVTVSMSIDAVKTVAANSTQSATTALTAQGILNVEYSSDLNTDTQITALGDRIRFGISDFTTDTALAVDDSYTTGVIANLNSAFTVEATTSGIISVVADLAVTANLNSTVSRIRDHSVTVPVTTESTAVISRIRDFDSTQNTAAQLAYGIERIRPAEITTGAITTDLFIAAKIGTALVDVQVISALSLIANITAAAQAATAAISSMSVDAVKITDVLSDQSAETALVGDGTTNLTGEAQFAVQSDLTADVNYLSENAANLSLSCTLTSTAGVLRGFAILQASGGNLTADIARIRDFSTDFQAISSELVLGTKVITIMANLTSQVTMITEGRDIDLAKYVYVIPEETRVWIIAEEIRTRKIKQETRIFKIRRY